MCINTPLANPLEIAQPGGPPLVLHSGYGPSKPTSVRTSWTAPMRHWVPGMPVQEAPLPQQLLAVAALCTFAALWTQYAVLAGLTQRRARLAPLQAWLHNFARAIPALMALGATPLMFDARSQPFWVYASSGIIAWWSAHKVLMACMGRGPLTRTRSLLETSLVLLMPAAFAYEEEIAQAQQLKRAQIMHREQLTPQYRAQQPGPSLPAPAAVHPMHGPVVATVSESPMTLLARAATKFTAAMVLFVTISTAAKHNAPCFLIDFALSWVIFSFFSLVMDGPAAILRTLPFGRGLVLLSHFDEPWKSQSFREFWNKRWNLCAGRILRELVYEPIVETLAPRPAAIEAREGQKQLWQAIDASESKMPDTAAHGPQDGHGHGTYADVAKRGAPGASSGSSASGAGRGGIPRRRTGSGNLGAQAYASAAGQDTGEQAGSTEQQPSGTSTSEVITSATPAMDSVKQAFKAAAGLISGQEVAAALGTGRTEPVVGSSDTLAGSARGDIHAPLGWQAVPQARGRGKPKLPIPLARALGVLACFAASGLMHEAIIMYTSWRVPVGAYGARGFTLSPGKRRGGAEGLAGMGPWAPVGPVYSFPGTAGGMGMKAPAPTAVTSPAHHHVDQTPITMPKPALSPLLSFLSELWGYVPTPIARGVAIVTKQLNPWGSTGWPAPLYPGVAGYMLGFFLTNGLLCIAEAAVAAMIKGTGRRFDEVILNSRYVPSGLVPVMDQISRTLRPLVRAVPRSTTGFGDTPDGLLPPMAMPVLRAAAVMLVEAYISYALWYPAFHKTGLDIRLMHEWAGWLNWAGFKVSPPTGPLCVS